MRIAAINIVYYTPEIGRCKKMPALIKMGDRNFSILRSRRGMHRELGKEGSRVSLFYIGAPLFTVSLLRIYLITSVL